MTGWLPAAGSRVIRRFGANHRVLRQVDAGRATASGRGGPGTMHCAPNHLPHAPQLSRATLASGRSARRWIVTSEGSRKPAACTGLVCAAPHRGIWVGSVWVQRRGRPPTRRVALPPAIPHTREGTGPVAPGIFMRTALLDGRGAGAAHLRQARTAACGRTVHPGAPGACCRCEPMGRGGGVGGAGAGGVASGRRCRRHEESIRHTMMPGKENLRRPSGWRSWLWRRGV